MADALCRLVRASFWMALALFCNSGQRVQASLLQADPTRLPSYVPADVSRSLLLSYERKEKDNGH
jgi:hypothetical protein